MTETNVQELLGAPRFGFKLRFLSVDPETGAFNDITGRVTAVDSFWYGERQPSLYGWSIGLSGYNYDRVLMAPGRIVRVYRSFTTVVDPDILWFEGYIQPGNVDVNWNTQQWSLSVVDIVTYLGRKRSPVFTLGELNVAEGSAVAVDSETQPEAIADQGEFIGYPDLSGDRAVDGDMGTLWVSGKAPAITDVPVSTAYTRMAVAEVYNPGFGLNRQLHQWIEIAARGSFEGNGIRVMTRYGMLALPEFELGEPFGPGTTNATKARFGILAFDAARFSSLFGNVVHAPVTEWKNGNINFGFNLDGRGDYIALHGEHIDGGVPDTGAHQWIVMYVEDGAAVTGSWTGTVNYSPPQPRQYIDLHVSSHSFVAGELEGWFVQCAYNLGGGAELYNKQRRITSNDASDGGNVVRVYVEGGWLPYGEPYSYVPVAGHLARLTPFPHATPGTIGPLWPLNDRLATPGMGHSNRSGTTMVFSGAGAWEEDDTPQPGWSGVSPNSALWSWISVQPPEMSFTLESPLSDGETAVFLSGTDGLLPAGSLYVGVQGPFPYSDKTVSGLTLTSAWAGGFVPQGTAVFQEQEGAAQRLWPVAKVRVKRRPIPVDDGSIRSIDSLRVFVSTLDAPRYPDYAEPGENWRDDWISGNAIWGVGPGNKDAVVTFNVPNGASYLDPNGHLRMRHYLFAIRSMSDQSQGRINEIDILPPDSVVSGSVTNLTVAGFFKTILVTMGVAEEDIQYGGGSTEAIGELSTDNSGYAAVLSDLAVRTGQVVWPGPKEGRVRISYNPNWPTSVALEPFAFLHRGNVRSARLTSRDDGSVSQVIVTTRDAEGNVGYGEYPPLPRSFGEIYADPMVYHAPASKAPDIARWVYWNMIADRVSVVTVGPAPWARPGEYRVELDWWHVSGVDLTGSYVIRSLDHRIGFGDGETARSWVSTLELVRLINTSHGEIAYSGEALSPEMGDPASTIITMGIGSDPGSIAPFLLGGLVTA